MHINAMPPYSGFLNRQLLLPCSQWSQQVEHHSMKDWEVSFRRSCSVSRTFSLRCSSVFSRMLISGEKNLPWESFKDLGVFNKSLKWTGFTLFVVMSFVCQKCRTCVCSYNARFHWITIESQTMSVPLAIARQLFLWQMTTGQYRVFYCHLNY
jgi:hypothetical protein